VAGTCQLKPLLEQRSFFTPLTVPKNPRTRSYLDLRTLVCRHDQVAG
jgi:hypothetical protein